MGALKQLVFVICLSAVSLSFLEMLAPQKRFQKMFKLFISLYFLTVLIIPFTQVKDIAGDTQAGLQNIESSFENNSIKEIVNNRLNTQVKQTLELQLSAALKEQNIEPLKLEVEFLQEEHEIEVTKVQVTVETDKNYLDEKIRTLLQQQVECDIEIVKQ